jgi:peptidylprolyl isomerase
MRRVALAARGCVGSQRGSRGWDYFSRWKADEGPAALVGFPDAAPGFTRPKAFFDVDIDGASAGRLVFELASDVAPKTCSNFISLCKGDGAFHYRGTRFHQVMASYITGGDVLEQDGGGGHSSVKGQRWLAEENHLVRHSDAGILSMSFHGTGGIGSQFAVTTVPSPHLDGKLVAFGRVVEGMDSTMKAIVDTYTVKGVPLAEILIRDSGVVE